MRGWPRRVAFILTLLAASSRAETPDASAGARIYGLGTGRDAMSALLPASGGSVDPANFPCASCHGDDGAGGREGGVEAPALTRARTMSPRAVEAWLSNALTCRQRSDGRKLGAAMPVFRLSKRDLAALAAYVRTLPWPAYPGMSETGITVAIRSAGTGLADNDAAVLRNLATARVSAFNAAGGTFGRSVQISFDEAGQSGPPTFARVAWAGIINDGAMISASVVPAQGGCGALYAAEADIRRAAETRGLGAAAGRDVPVLLPFDVDRQQRLSAQVLASGAHSRSSASAIVSLLDLLDVLLDGLQESGRRIAPKALCTSIERTLSAQQRISILRGEAVEIVPVEALADQP